MSDYSVVDKVFHRIVLGSGWVGEMLLDLDGMVTGRDVADARAPVFVTGLARAGTTALMRALHSSGQFASLTYADMPMVMAPNLWARISAPFEKDRVTKERAHKDGVMVDFDAPEALEEVFWRTFCSKEYATAASLVPHDPSDEVIEAYRIYQNRICHRHGVRRYLAKNNNTLLRLLPLAHAFPDAVFFVLIREPLARAVSLRNQHVRFAKADNFTRSYMTWLAHHEFGADLRAYCLPGQVRPQGDPLGIEYWLMQWLACYAYLSDQLARAPGNIHVVGYERLCTDPATWSELAALAGISSMTESGFHSLRLSPAVASGADPALLARARAVYTNLRAIASG